MDVPTDYAPKRTAQKVWSVIHQVLSLVQSVRGGDVHPTEVAQKAEALVNVVDDETPTRLKMDAPKNGLASSCIHAIETYAMRVVVTSCATARLRCFCGQVLGVS